MTQQFESYSEGGKCEIEYFFSFKRLASLSRHHYKTNLQIASNSLWCGIATIIGAMAFRISPKYRRALRATKFKTNE